MMEAKIIIKMNSKDNAKIVSLSISPEIKKKIPNSKINLYFDDDKIFLNIVSKNVSSLRAACNSYLRWINTAYNVTKSI
jgi:tRNA threonylcarbamoyladenosine modification (KEOPS) complex  Pcc1 subunit